MNQSIYQDPQNNSIRMSSFSKLESECPFGGLGIKFVGSGEEVYFVNQKRFTVKAGEYMVGNSFTQSVVQINSKEQVRGLCIDLSPEVIREVAESSNQPWFVPTDFLLSDQFFVNRYSVHNTRFGKLLLQMNHKICSWDLRNDLLKNEIFYGLAQSMLADQGLIFEHLTKLDFKKKNTNEELLRAVLEAKALMDNRIADNFSLDFLAKHAGISKFHFIRLFKLIFETTPYQYQQNIRLDQSKLAIQNGLEVSTAADIYGFPDVSSFSKAFKKRYGSSPGILRKSNF
ncbi:MAG: hypothetical protein RL025_1212 [Bacteroidota bacterium]